MSDLDRVSEGRFLELEVDKRVLAGEGGGNTGTEGGVAGTGVSAGGLSGFDGTTMGFRGNGPGIFLGWERCRCEATWRSENWDGKEMGWRGFRIYRGGLQGVRTGLGGGMTSTLRTVPAAGAPGVPELSTRGGAQAFNLTLAGLDQSGRGGGRGLCFVCSPPAGELSDVVSSDSVVELV